MHHQEVKSITFFFLFLLKKNFVVFSHFLLFPLFSVFFFISSFVSLWVCFQILALFRFFIQLILKMSFVPIFMVTFVFSKSKYIRIRNFNKIRVLPEVYPYFSLF